tara:strand:- start:1456 stop:2130 length:675 start_codon:yes stop_codon:yes gene_type:complete
MNKDNNNEGERAAQEYVDTTLRSSHYNQTQRIEDATDGNTRKLSTIHKIVLSSIFCIVATWLCTGYVIYKHGSFLFNGDSIEGLRKQIESSETSAGLRYNHNRKVAAAFRRTRDDVETGLHDQIDKLNAEIDKLKAERDHLHEDTHILTDKFIRERAKFEFAESQAKALKLEVGEFKNYRSRVEKQITGLQRQLGTLVDILRANEDEEVVTKKKLGKGAIPESN